jgi:hypothetical protein
MGRQVRQICFSAFQSNFNKRDSLERGKPMCRRFSLRSDSFHWRNGQRLTGVTCKGEIYACFLLLLIKVRLHIPCKSHSEAFTLAGMLAGCLDWILREHVILLRGGAYPPIICKPFKYLSCPRPECVSMFLASIVTGARRLG